MNVPAHQCLDRQAPGSEIDTSFVQIQPIWRMHTLLPRSGSRVRSIMQVDFLQETFYARSVVRCTVFFSFNKCKKLFAASLMVRIAIKFVYYLTALALPQIMPAWLTTTLLALLLTLLSYKLVIRGMATFVKESRDIAEARATIEEEVPFYFTHSGPRFWVVIALYIKITRTLWNCSLLSSCTFQLSLS